MPCLETKNTMAQLGLNLTALANQMITLRRPHLPHSLEVYLFWLSAFLFRRETVFLSFHAQETNISSGLNRPLGLL